MTSSTPRRQRRGAWRRPGGAHRRYPRARRRADRQGPGRSLRGLRPGVGRAAAHPDARFGRRARERPHARSARLARPASTWAPAVPAPTSNRRLTSIAAAAGRAATSPARIELPLPSDRPHAASVTHARVLGPSVCHEAAGACRIRCRRDVLVEAILAANGDTLVALYGTHVSREEPPGDTRPSAPPVRSTARTPARSTSRSKRAASSRSTAATPTRSRATYICGKVRRFGERMYGEDRLLYPAVRTGAEGRGHVRPRHVGRSARPDRQADGSDSRQRRAPKRSCRSATAARTAC